MKKYLIGLLPFIVCLLLGVYYASLEPKGFPDPTYPYRTPVMLQYLSSRWIIIGIVLSSILYIIILIEDISKYIEKKLWERRIKKNERK